MNKEPGQSLEMAMKEKALKDNLSKIKHKIFVMSGKGGVGKSSVTVNLAAALAATGLKVGVLDVDFHGPSIPRLFGIGGKHVEADDMGHMTPVKVAENLWAISMDVMLPDRDMPIIWRGPVKTGVVKQMISDVKWGELDVLLIDSPPGTGDEHLTVMQAIPDAQAIVVTTPQEVSLADVRKAINFLDEVNGKILGLVENMSGLICPHCGKEIDIFRKHGGKRLAIDRGIFFLGEIPLDPLAVIAADRGIPAVLMEEDSPTKKAFREMAVMVAKRLQS